MSSPTRALTRLTVAFTAAALTLVGSAAVAPAADAAPRWKTTTTTKRVDTVLRSADGSIDRVTVTNTKTGWVADIRTKVPGKTEKRTRVAGKGTSWDAYRIVEGSDGTVAFVSAPRDHLKTPAKLWTRARGSAKWTNRAVPVRTAESSATPGVDIARNGTVTLAYMAGDKVLTSTLARGGRWTAPRTALTSPALRNLAYGDAYLTLDVAPDGSADLLYTLTGIAADGSSPVCDIRLVTRARTGTAFTGAKRFGHNTSSCGAAMVRAGTKTVVATMTGATRMYVRATPTSAWTTSLKTHGYVTLVGSDNGRATALASTMKSTRIYSLGAGRATKFTKASFTLPPDTYIAQDAKGRTLLTYRARTTRTDGDSKVFARVSTPSGTTWAKPKLLGLIADGATLHETDNVVAADAAGNGKFVVTWPAKAGTSPKTWIATRG